MSQNQKDNDEDVCMYACVFRYKYVCVHYQLLSTSFNDLQLQQHYLLHNHIIDYYFSSHSSSSSSYDLLLCMSLSIYHYFPPHLTITPSFLLIYFSVYYFLQNGYTPLYLACQNGHESTVLVLLENGADPNLQTKVTSRRMIDDDRRW